MESGRAKIGFEPSKTITMARTSTHFIEIKSKDCVRSRINSFGDSGDYIFRELSERDYGIDAIIECFDGGVPTGKIAFLQIKGTDSVIVPLKRTPVVSCGSISVSNLHYAKQNRIPVIIIFVSLKNARPMYYADLREVSSEVDFREGADRVTIHIPQENCTFDDISPILKIIDHYYL